MTHDPFSSGDWLKIKVKFPGKCIKCKGGLEPGNTCYWSRSTKAIVHEECYLPSLTNPLQIGSDVGEVKALTRNESSNNKDVHSQNNKHKRSTKCFICSNPIEIDNNLISALYFIGKADGRDYESIYCPTCLESFDDKKYEMYRKSFMRKIDT